MTLPLKPIRPYILGIDPGFTGALALYDPFIKKLHSIIDMPLITSPTKQLDKGSLALILEGHAASIAYAVLEDVGAMPNDGRASLFKFAVGKGILEGMLASLMIPVHMPTPAVWKIRMGLNSQKSKSRELASQLFPSHAQSFARAMDDGRAEAVLLAVFGETYKHVWKNHA